jgi:EmrB/QacA subfamily drug resistance transporter
VSAQPTNNHKWLTLVAMTGALSMILIDEVVVSVALPSIQRDLDMSQTALNWVVNAYLLTLAAFIALAGHLSDRLGRVRVCSAGIVLFALASAGAGLAAEPAHILVARAIQGIGGAMLIPSSQAIVTSAFPVEERGRAMGIYAGISLGFLAIGPLIGGLLTETAGWEWVFFVNVPVGAATLGLIAYAHPPGRPQGGGRFDAVGTALVVPGLTAMVYGLMQSGTWGWDDPRTIGLVAAGVALLLAFVLVELRRRYPLVQLRLLRSGNFAGDSFVLFVVQFQILGVSVFGAVYAQDVLGFSPIEAGLAITPVTIPLLVLAPISGRVYDRIGARLPVAAGCALTAVGLFAGALVLVELDYWYLVPAYFVLGVGLAFIMTPATTDGMNASPPELRGEASGLLQTLRQVGGSFGIAVMTGIVVSLNHSNLDENLRSEGISGAKAEKLEGFLAEAQQGGSTQRFSSVPARERDEVTAAAKDAYASSLRVGWLVLAGVMALAAAIAAAVLRRIDYAAQTRAPPHPLAAHAAARGTGAPTRGPALESSP